MPPNEQNSPPKPVLNPKALALTDTAKLLSKASGAPVSEEMLHADVEGGAPLNPDGTLNLVTYAAWLVKEIGDRS